MKTETIYTTTTGIKIDWPFFTDDQKNRLRTELEKFDPEKVERFISSLQLYCQTFHLTKSAPSRADQRAALISMKKDFQAAANHLKRLITGKTSLQHLRLMSDLIGGKNALSGANAAMIAATEALPHIKKIISLIDSQLKTEKRGKGRPKSVTTDFVFGIAKLFKKYLAKPTTTRFGPFEEVCELAIAAVGLPVVDAARSIREAVKKMV